MADIIDDPVVMLAPEERDGGKALPHSEDVERRCLSLPFSAVPMFDRNALATVAIRPARGIARRETELCAHSDMVVAPPAKRRRGRARFRQDFLSKNMREPGGLHKI